MQLKKWRHRVTCVRHSKSRSDWQSSEAKGCILQLASCIRSSLHFVVDLSPVRYEEVYMVTDNIENENYQSDTERSHEPTCMAGIIVPVTDRSL